MTYISINEKDFEKHKKEMKEEGDEGNLVYSDENKATIDEIEGNEIHVSIQTDIGYIGLDIEIGLDDMLEILKHYTGKLEEIQALLKTKF